MISLADQIKCVERQITDVEQLEGLSIGEKYGFHKDLPALRAVLKSLNTLEFLAVLVRLFFLVVHLVLMLGLAILIIRTVDGS